MFFFFILIHKEERGGHLENIFWQCFKYSILFRVRLTEEEQARKWVPVFRSEEVTFFTIMIRRIKMPIYISAATLLTVLTVPLKGL